MKNPKKFYLAIFRMLCCCTVKSQSIGTTLALQLSYKQSDRAIFNKKVIGRKRENPESACSYLANSLNLTHI